MFLSTTFPYCLSSPLRPILPHWPLSLRPTLCHCPDQLQAATTSYQAQHHRLFNSNPYLRSHFSPTTSLLRLPSKLSPQSSHLKLTLPRNHTMACFPHRLLTMAFNANIIPTALHWFGLNHFFLLHLSSGSSTQPPATEPNQLTFPEVPHPVPPPSQSSHHLLNLECQPLILAYLLIDFPDLH